MGSAVTQRIQGLTHGRQLLRATPLRSQARRLDFQADAQFENRQHVAQGDDGRRVDAEATGARRIQDKGTDTVASLHQAGGLQARQRLAHHGTADALLFHDRRLGRQLVAALDHPVTDLLGQLSHQFLGQATVLPASARWGVLIIHIDGLSRLTARPPSYLSKLYDDTPLHADGVRNRGARRLSHYIATRRPA
ncbi:hypothetical protein FQZ97_923950 [compost metagenome]